MAGPINWMSNSKDSRVHAELSGERREPTFRTIPLPTEMDHNSIPVRNRWKNVGKNQQVRRIFVPAGLSMFAETMRACLEEYHGRVFSSFSEVVNNSMPFWDKLSDSDQEGWTARARVEKKNDHYIYIRKAREKVCDEQKVVTSQLSDYESDPDELPGEICIVKSSERLVGSVDKTQPTCSSPSSNAAAESQTKKSVEQQDNQQSLEENFARIQLTVPSQSSHGAGDTTGTTEDASLVVTRCIPNFKET